MFWECVKGIKAFTQPPSDLIYALESDSASLSKAYNAIKEMGKLVANALDNVATQEYAAEFKEIFDERLQYGFHAIFVLAAMLDPALYPYVHNIPMEERIKAEELLVNFFGLSKAFANAALGQLKAYREGRHEIPDYASENPALVADAVGFWKDYGLENPAVKHLAKVAIRVLGIPPPAAGGERSWSTWRRVWSDEGNRLLSGRVALLVYCHYNQRVLDRAYDSWTGLDWDSFIQALEEEDPIRAPEGHAALDVPGVEPISEDEEEALESDGEENGQENVTPNDNALARAEAEEAAMMKMTEDGPY